LAGSVQPSYDPREADRARGKFKLMLQLCALVHDQVMLRPRSQPFNRPPHCKETSPVDDNSVDFVDFDERNTKGRQRLD
jgi:hypothetical protein